MIATWQMLPRFEVGARIQQLCLDRKPSQQPSGPSLPARENAWGHQEHTRGSESSWNTGKNLALSSSIRICGIAHTCNIICVSQRWQMEHKLLGETSGFLNPEFLLMQLAMLYWEEAVIWIYYFHVTNPLEIPLDPPYSGSLDRTGWFPVSFEEES